MIAPYECKNVLIQGVTLTNSPSWTINTILCDNVTIDNVTINNPYDSPIQMVLTQNLAQIFISATVTLT